MRKPKIDPDEMAQLAAFHYLPGLRYVRDMIDEMISAFEPRPVQVMTEEGLPKSKGTGGVYTNEEKRQLIEAAKSVGLSEVHRRTGIAVSSIAKWKKELKKSA